MDVHNNSIMLVLFVEQRTEEEFSKKMANNLTSLFKLIKNLSEKYYLKTLLVDASHLLADAAFALRRAAADILFISSTNEDSLPVKSPGTRRIFVKQKSAGV
jgi:hypothetical protein